MFHANPIEIPKELSTLQFDLTITASAQFTCQKNSSNLVLASRVCGLCVELAEDKRGWMELVRAIHNPKSRKCSYTRRTTEASEILEMEAEDWYKGAQTLQFNG